MAVIRFAGFAGENRAVEPKLLADSVLTVSRNQKPGRGDLRSWRYDLPVANVGQGFKTIYRMGRDVQSDSQYWLRWNSVVHAVRGFNADDTTEQTFYTGDGYPKFTNNVIGLATAPYPTASRPMGLPAPLTAPTVTAAAYSVENEGKYQYKLPYTTINFLEVGDVFRITVGGMVHMLTLTEPTTDAGVTPTSLMAQLNTIDGITTTAVAESATDVAHLLILSDAAGTEFTIEQKTGTSQSYDAADVTLTDYLTAYAQAESYSGVTIGSTVGAGSMVAGQRYRINSVADSDFTLVGAPTNSSLTVFTATGPTTGSGTVDVVTGFTGTNWSCKATITDTMIAAMVTGQRFQITINNEPPVAVTVQGGTGTFPVKPTADTVKNAFDIIVTLSNTINTNSTTGSRSVTLAHKQAYAGSTLSIKSITPGSIDEYTTYAKGVQITNDNLSTVSSYYVYTYVNDFGWESAPSPVSEENIRYAEAQATISGFVDPPDGNYNVTTIRVYKTQTGSNTNFYFLGDIALGTSQIIDTNASPGELLETTTWLPAPGVETGGTLDTTEPVLTNLTAMWNGMMAGISGNAVRVCEPYIPYAWPKAYEVIPPDSKPVALGVFGQNLLILTTGRPVLVNGSGPDGLDQQKIEMPQACVAPRSVVNMGAGVAWASEDGLCWFGSGGARILTAGIMLREDWQKLNPNTIVGCMYEGLYFGSYIEDTRFQTRRGFFIDPANPQGIYFLDVGYEAMHFDELRDHLYVLFGAQIRKWDSAPDTGEGSGFFTYRARSKVFKQPYARNYGAAEVVASSYPVTFRLIADGQQVFETVVEDRIPFRLPGGFRAVDYQIELEGTEPVQGVAIATSMQELADV